MQVKGLVPSDEPQLRAPCPAAPLPPKTHVHTNTRTRSKKRKETAAGGPVSLAKVSTAFSLP